MKQISIELEHCYGIKRLVTTLEFTKANACAIYAPNGTMKSSFARTFQDIASGRKTTDKMFPTRATKREINDQDGVELKPAQVLVIQPYDEVFGHSSKTSNLLINRVLREEYEKLHADLETATESLLKALRVQSGTKKDISKEISSTFTRSEKSLYLALTRIEEELLAQDETPFVDVVYDIIFDEKVLAFLGTKDVQAVLRDYITKYNELLDASTYFRKGVFTYYNAGSISKSLADNGFFKANHSINLKSGEILEITSQAQLDTLIAGEKAQISDDKELRKKFAELEKLITKNANVRDFDAYLSNKEDLLPHLKDIEIFREQVWKSYLRANLPLYQEVLARYRAAEVRRKEIEKEASSERTQWEKVIEIFNDRFYVPFTLVPKNRTEVILGQEALLTLGFKFHDGEDEADVERDKLLEVLSTGEKKALYILNLLFEIETRRNTGEKTLLIVDDIADSFDYKNKYAIIQYLRDIADSNDFVQVILTHNFDFFRTIKGRFVGYSNCYMVTKTKEGVQLHQATGIDNIFVNDWKKNFDKEPKKRVACIPFMRNLVEFTSGEDVQEFKELTALLHWKTETPTLVNRDLYRIYNQLFRTDLVVAVPEKPVIEDIMAVAEECLNEPEATNFETKIVLAIAIRLMAEKWMVERLGNPAITDVIRSNQTNHLYRKLKEKGDDEVILGVLDRVLLMTPENIHLNAFMYEPIMDMSSEHLRRLYREVQAL